MAIRLGDTAPDFTADSTQGTIRFHEWLGDGWGILFSHPKDFTPVCTTELGACAKLKPEFEQRNCKVIGLSVDTTEDHEKWSADIEETQGAAVDFPLIADPERKVATLYDMLHPNADTTFTVRSVFVIGPDKQVKLTLTYPASTGRNFDELLRVLDSLQLTADHQVATPANWRDGEDVIIVPTLSDADAKQKFPKGFETVKPYLRVTPQPNREASAPFAVERLDLGPTVGVRVRTPRSSMSKRDGFGTPLRTPRLVLRPFRFGDARGYAALLGDPDARRFLSRSDPPRGSPPGPASVALRILAHRLEHRFGRALRFALEHEGRFGGFVAVHRLREPVAWLSYAVVPALRRRGLGREALWAAIDRVRAGGGSPGELAAHTHPANPGSAALLESLGFAPAGRIETPAGPRDEHRLRLS